MVELKSRNTETIIEEKGYKKKPQPKAKDQKYEYSNKNTNRPKRRHKFKEGEDTEYAEREESYDLKNQDLQKAGIKLS